MGRVDIIDLSGRIVGYIDNARGYGPAPVCLPGGNQVGETDGTGFVIGNPGSASQELRGVLGDSGNVKIVNGTDLLLYGAGGTKVGELSDPLPF